MNTEQENRISNTSLSQQCNDTTVDISIVKNYNRTGFDAIRVNSTIMFGDKVWTISRHKNEPIVANIQGGPQVYSRELQIMKQELPEMLKDSTVLRVSDTADLRGYFDANIPTVSEPAWIDHEENGLSQHTLDSVACLLWFSFKEVITQMTGMHTPLTNDVSHELLQKLLQNITKDNTRVALSILSVSNSVLELLTVFDLLYHKDKDVVVTIAKKLIELRDDSAHVYFKEYTEYLANHECPEVRATLTGVSTVHDELLKRDTSIPVILGRVASMSDNELRLTLLDVLKRIDVVTGADKLLVIARRRGFKPSCISGLGDILKNIISHNDKVTMMELTKIMCSVKHHKYIINLINTLVDIIQDIEFDVTWLKEMLSVIANGFRRYNDGNGLPEAVLDTFKKLPVEDMADELWAVSELPDSSTLRTHHISKFNPLIQNIYIVERTEVQFIDWALLANIANRDDTPLLLKETIRTVTLSNQQKEAMRIKRLNKKLLVKEDK